MTLTERKREGAPGRTGPILAVRNLRTAFFTDKEVIRAVDGVSFNVKPGETVGIVGESGSGKSATARSIMRLIEPPGRILDGSSIRFHHPGTVREFADRFPGRTVDLDTLRSEHDPAALFDHPLVDATPSSFGYDDPEEATLEDFVGVGYGDALGLEENDCVFLTEGDPNDPLEGFVEVTRLDGHPRRAMRGGRIAMVFQDPLTSLNPVHTVGKQIEEALGLHQGLSGRAATREAIDLLEAVGISDARRRVAEYPHQFSGGMCQRVVIAMALACDPEVLICDEPTTALDVTLQAQILDLFEDLRAERDLAIIFITHDMGVIAEVSDRVNVMYAGEIVETAGVEPLFAEPRHPYTRGLLAAIPGRRSGDRLRTIEGTVPTPNEPATHCRFAPRCPESFADCERVHPVSLPVNAESDDHRAACLLYPEDRSTEEAVERHAGRDDSISETNAETRAGDRPADVDGTREGEDRPSGGEDR